MKNKFYTLRFLRNGQSSTGYTPCAVTRFPSLEEAEAHASALAHRVLPEWESDYIAIGEGAVRDGLSVGRGRRIAELFLRGEQIVCRPGSL